MGRISRRRRRVLDLSECGYSTTPERNDGPNSITGWSLPQPVVRNGRQPKVTMCYLSTPATPSRAWASREKRSLPAERRQTPRRPTLRCQAGPLLAAPNDASPAEPERSLPDRAKIIPTCVERPRRKMPFHASPDLRCEATPCRIAPYSTMSHVACRAAPGSTLRCSAAPCLRNHACGAERCDAPSSPRCPPDPDVPIVAAQADRRLPDGSMPESLTPLSFGVVSSLGPPGRHPRRSQAPALARNEPSYAPIQAARLPT